MTKGGPKLLGEIAEERHVLGELMSWEERAIRHPPQPSPSSPDERTSVGGQLWKHGERAIVKELVTSALNARNWQSGRINEGLTLEQYHAVHCNSQQVEGSAGWDRHSSSDRHNRQMDGQDEGGRRIYNQRDLTKIGRAIQKTPESSSCAVSEEEKKNSSLDEAWGRTLTFPPQLRRWRSCFPNDPAWPLTKSSQRPSSWARFSTKFIVLGLLGLGSLISTMKDTHQIGTLQLAPFVGRTCMLVRTIIEQGRAKPLRGNDDGQPTGPQMENCQEVPSSTGVWRHVRGPRPYQRPDDSRTSRAASIGPRWRKTATVWNAFKGLRGANSFWRSVLVPSNSLEQSNGAAAWANPQGT